MIGRPVAMLLAAAAAVIAVGAPISVKQQINHPRGGASNPPSGANPHPIALNRPSRHPLSPVAALGRQIFDDPGLSHDRSVACATCHASSRSFAAPPGLPAELTAAGRAVPSLKYLDRVPNFSIGPDDAAELDGPPAMLSTSGAPTSQAPSLPGGGSMAVKAGVGEGGVPRGGLFWDGRVNTLQDQTFGPLLSAGEMGNRSVFEVAERLRRAPYYPRLVRLFGAGAVATDTRLVDEAMFAVARYQLEDAAFHPYSSKYDAYLEGRAVLTPAEARGLAAFDDSTRGNCASCHLDRVGPNRQPPMFTDFQFEALGVPRNRRLALNRDSTRYDLGLCGPTRRDLAMARQFCGMFRTPSLRNVATRTRFFHNGVDTTLEQVMEFYRLRDVHPERTYPSDAGGRVRRFDDLPDALRANVDTTPPFGGVRGGAPAFSEAESRDMIAFLKTLTDGFGAAPPEQKAPEASKRPTRGRKL